MLVIQLTGLSGAGKTTIANHVKMLLQSSNIPVEVIDGDLYRKTVCSDLGFSKEDRCENIRRLGKIAFEFSQKNIIGILAVINPFEEVRNELKVKYFAKTVFIDCDLKTLIHRDTKGLYQRALLSDEHPRKLFNLTGINDPYEPPTDPDLIIRTYIEDQKISAKKLYNFILSCINYTTVTSSL